jgi:hypothetical protein
MRKMTQKRTLQPSDILPLKQFLEIRPAKQQEMMHYKKHRRFGLGPEVTFYFENHQTLWWQIQEMLRIEQGGEAQLADELAAYTPLIPQGKELISTVMIEIEDPLERRQKLSQLGNFEHSLVMRFAGYRVQGAPAEDTERTNELGKTSSVHFIHWRFTEAQIQAFCQPGCDIIVESTHPNYGHKTIMPENVRVHLAEDFWD